MSSKTVRPRPVKRRRVEKKQRTAPKKRRTVRVPRSPPQSFVNSHGRVGVSTNSLTQTAHPGDMRVRERRFGDVLNLSGTEYIGAVIIPEAGDGPGTILYQRYNNAAPPNTRLSQVANIYERWKPKRYEYHFISSTPPQTRGSYIMAQEADPARIFSSGASGVVPALRVIPGSIMRQIWQDSACSLPRSRDYTSLWCFDPDAGTTDASDRLDLAGQLIVASVVPSAQAVGTVLGIIELVYDVDFFVPRLAGAGTAHTAEVKIANPASSATPVVPAGSGTVALLRNTMANLQEFKGNLGSDSVASAIKFFNQFGTYAGSSSSSSLSSSPGARGFPPGFYTLRWVLASTTKPDPANVSWLHVRSLASTGCAFVDATPSDFIPLAGVGALPAVWTAPDAVDWAYAEEFSISFASIDDTPACYVSCLTELTAFGASPPPDIETVMWFYISCAAAGVTYDLDLLAPSRRSRPRVKPLPRDTDVARPVRIPPPGGPLPVPSHEGKEEKKVLPPMNSGPDSDIEYYPPPVFRPNPSSYPGTPSYVPRTTTLALPKPAK